MKSRGLIRASTSASALICLVAITSPGLAKCQPKQPNCHDIPANGVVFFDAGTLNIEPTGPDGKPLHDGSGKLVTKTPKELSYNAQGKLHKQGIITFPYSPGPDETSLAIPNMLLLTDGSNKQVPVDDFIQTTGKPSKKKSLSQGESLSANDDLAFSELKFEAVQQDKSTGLLSLHFPFQAIADILGYDEIVTIPDLYIDAPGVTLYSVIDLNVYLGSLSSIPSFAIGDTFEIVNGRVAALPGMMFSLTPFKFDPVNGFEPESNLLSAQSTMTGTVLSTHGVEAIPGVPESPTWMALLMGFGALGATMRYRRRGTGVSFG